ncbi:DUF4097 family beta strand repeat protein [bacterium]|nr:DUF4097 family beta strand repeat protein [bacterium]
MIRNHSICHAALCTVLGAGLLFAGVEKKHVNNIIPFRAGGDVSVKNTNGEIAVSTHSAETVIVDADIRVSGKSRERVREMLDRIRIVAEQRGDRLHIEADYPKSRTGGFFGWLFGNSVSVKVDFAVTVPERSNLDASSVNGKIEITGVTGEVQGETTNGSVRIAEISGAIRARSTNGSITIDVADFPADAGISAHTVNGSVKCYLPERVAADCSGSTVNGGIRSDFPLTVSGRFLNRDVEGTINGGGGRIELKTVNGSVGILHR